jgi:hypothetical protein
MDFSFLLKKYLNNFNALLFKNTSTLWLQDGSTGGYEIRSNSSTVLNDSNWHHLVVVRDGDHVDDNWDGDAKCGDDCGDYRVYTTD